MNYGLHPSEELVQIFKQRPYQGASPGNSKVLILGNDANYSKQVSDHVFFKRILEYHDDGVKFWRENGVHHPFLIDEYPFSRSEGGVPYHRNFSKLDFDDRFADKISFVELLNVPTIGNTNSDKRLFHELLDRQHLQWLEDMIFGGPKKFVLVNQTLARNIAKISRKHHVLERLNTLTVNRKVSEIVFESSELVLFNGYSFSYSVTNAYLGELKERIDRFLCENGCKDLYRRATRYSFNGSQYTKGRLVWAILNDYISSNHGCTYSELKEVFPSELQGAMGVFWRYKEARDHAERTRNPKHYLSEGSVLQLEDSAIAVSTHWGNVNFTIFLEHAVRMGYDISEKNAFLK